MAQTVTFPIDFNAIRAAIANEIVKVTGLTQNQVLLYEPEQPNQPRPSKPYFTFKITGPGFKYGDDSKDYVSGQIWNSGGPRKMTVAFDCYGNNHEAAYNYMSLWQTALDLENIQADLRVAGIAVWIIGAVADLSVLLNTGYEGRAHMECDFGVAFNLQSNLGEIDAVTVTGKISTDTGTVTTSETVTD